MNKTGMWAAALGATAGLLAWTAPAQAKESGVDFMLCDRLAAPKAPKPNGKFGDHWQMGVGFVPQTLKLPFGAKGVEACDRALADPRLDQRYTERRARLLLYKALHQIAAKEDFAALVSLDESDRLIASGEARLAARYGPGNRAVRAVGLFRMNKAAEAEAVLKALSDARPYSLSVRSLTNTVRLIFNDDPAARRALMREQAVYSPGHLRLLFIDALAKGRFEDAVTLSPQVSFDLPRSRGGWQIEGTETRKHEMIEDRARFAGSTAYALAAIGRAAQAKAKLDEARAALLDAAEPPAAPEEMEYIGSNKRKDWEKRKAAAATGRAIVDQWEQAILFRAKAKDMSFDEVMAPQNVPDKEAVVVAADFLRQARVDGLPEAKKRDAVVEAVERMSDESIVKALGLTIAEFADRLDLLRDTGGEVKMRREGGNWFRTDLEGYAIFKADDPELFNVRFGTLSAPPAAVEEAALLKAADRAAELGMDGIVLESVQVIRRQFVTYGGGPVSSGGNEVRLLVRPVRIASLPKHIAEAQWRVLPVAGLRAALAPKYPPMP